MHQLDSVNTQPLISGSVHMYTWALVTVLGWGEATEEMRVVFVRCV